MKNICTWDENTVQDWTWTRTVTIQLNPVPLKISSFAYGGIKEALCLICLLEKVIPTQTLDYVTLKESEFCLKSLFSWYFLANLEMIHPQTIKSFPV